MMAAGMLMAAGLLTGCKNLQQLGIGRNDQQIAADVQAKIHGESALANQNIQASVNDGVATLSGTVGDEASRALAGNDVGTVSGVKTVVNNLTVQAPQTSMVLPSLTGNVPAAPIVVPEPALTKERTDRHDRRQDHARDDVQPQQPAPAPVQTVQNTPAPQPAPLTPPAPPKPQFKTVELPAGTVIPVRVTETLDSGTAQANQAFHGAVAADLGTQGVIAIPHGAAVTGRIADVREAAHFKGSSLLSIELTEVDARGKRLSLLTDTYNKEGAARGKNTAIKSGGGAALGAIIGGLAGGGKGAAIGAIAGGGAGAGVNAATRGQQAVIQTETVVSFTLRSPITVTVPVGGPDTVYGETPDPQLQQR
jgi:hypothetical protein